MLCSVEQAFAGRDEKRASLKTPAWEATPSLEIWGTTTPPRDIVTRLGSQKHPCFYEQIILIKTELQLKILQTQGRRETAITKNYPGVNLSNYMSPVKAKRASRIYLEYSFRSARS